MARHSADSVNVVFLRSPRTQILSTFLECTYDEWGIFNTGHYNEHVDGVFNKTGKRLPRFPRTGNQEADFQYWLDHFVQLSPDKVGGEHDFRCVDPRELQTRHMSCSLGPVPYKNDWVNHALKDPPDLARALRNNQAAHLLGITDLYDASACMMFYRLTGLLTEGCACSDSAPVAWTKVTHGVPSHSDEMTYRAQRTADMLSKLDGPLYKNGLLRFLCDIRAFEAHLNQQVLCPTKLEKLWKKIKYLFPQE